MSIDYYFITCVQLNHFLLLPLRMQFLQDALQEIIKMEDKVSSLRADIQRKEEIVRSLQKKQKVVHFDEETIAEHDKERGTRMKIDEPPTPYVRDAPPVLDFPDIKDDNNVDPDIPLLPSVSLNPSNNLPEQPRPASPELQEQEVDESVISKPSPLDGGNHEGRLKRPQMLDINLLKDSVDKAAQGKSNFEIHRSHHYNEFQALKKWREKHQSEDENESNEENGDDEQETDNKSQEENDEE